MLFPYTALGGEACRPELLVRLLPLTEIGTAAAELETLVGLDPALCMQLLVLSGPQPPQTRATLVNLLNSCGGAAVHSLVQTAALRQLQAPTAHAGTRQIWHRCLLMALTARRLAKLQNYASPDEAYLAALLLRCGQLMMMLHGGEVYARLLAASPCDEAQQLAQERRRYGATHIQLSTTLLQGSALSPVVLDALRYHSLAPAQLREAHPLTRILRLADLISSPADGPLTAEPAALWFGLDQAALATLSSHSRSELASLLLRFGLQPAAANSEGDEHREGDLEHALWVRALFPVTEADHDSFWGKLRASLTLRFGLRAVLLLQHHRAAQTLHVVARDGAAATADFSLHCVPGLSLAADACLLGQPRNSFEHGMVVADEQIARLLGKTGLLCLPFAGGVLVAAVELDELRHLQAQLAAVQALLDAAGRALPRAATAAPTEDFLRRIRVAQHEIAAPLTTLHNYLHVLQSKSSGADEELRIMRAELSRIARLVEHIGQAQPTVRVSSVELNSLLGDVLAGFQLAAPGMVIQADLATALPTLQSDAVALKQIFTNLIQNALEAMPQGGRLLLSSAASSDGEQLIVTVADTGSGIAPTAMSQLFVAKASSKSGHAGLGLSIVKQLLDALGGSIACQSLPQLGTRFLVSLPQRLPQ